MIPDVHYGADNNAASLKNTMDNDSNPVHIPQSKVNEILEQMVC